MFHPDNSGSSVPLWLGDWKYQIDSSRGRIQDLWLGGGVSRRGVWGPHTVPPAGRRQSPGRGPRGGEAPPPKLWGFEELQTFN